jgi:hypothetical protein
VIKELDPATKKTAVIAPALAGSQYLTWLTDGGMLMASGTKLSAWHSDASGWVDVADLSSAGITQVTRLCASPDGKWLALVAMPPAAK